VKGIGEKRPPLANQKVGHPESSSNLRVNHALSDRLGEMTVTTAHDSRRLGVPLARTVGLLAISVLINYIDRGNLSIAAPLLKEELHVSASQLGILFAAFFWTYTVLMPVSGWLVDRFNVNWVLAVGFVVWSLATTVTGLAQGFYMLMACRVVLGAGESVAFPCYAKILAQHVPQQHRRWNELRPGNWHIRVWDAHGKLWLASRIHLFRTGEPYLVAAMDTLDAKKHYR